MKECLIKILWHFISLFQLYCAQWLGKDHIIVGGCDANMVRVIDRGTLKVNILIRVKRIKDRLFCFAHLPLYHNNGWVSSSWTWLMPIHYTMICSSSFILIIIYNFVILWMDVAWFTTNGHFLLSLVCWHAKLGHLNKNLA